MVVSFNINYIASLVQETPPTKQPRMEQRQTRTGLVSTSQRNIISKLVVRKPANKNSGHDNSRAEKLTDKRTSEITVTEEEWSKGGPDIVEGGSRGPDIVEGGSRGPNIVEDGNKGAEGGAGGRGGGLGMLCGYSDGSEGDSD